MILRRVEKDPLLFLEEELAVSSIFRYEQREGFSSVIASEAWQSREKNEAKKVVRVKHILPT